MKNKGAIARWATLPVALFLVFSATLPTSAQEITSTGEFTGHRPATTDSKDQAFNENYLLGDWLGLRPLLAARGIKLEVLLTSDPFGNPIGGKSQGFTAFNLLGVDLTLDTEKLMGWRGGEARIGFSDCFGTSLSKRYVGNTFPIQLPDAAPIGPRLTYVAYTQSFFDDKLSLRAGRLTINSVYYEEFAASEYFKSFSSVAFNLVPMGLFLNAPGAFGYPLTTWGARIKFQPVKAFYTMVGCYNGDPGVKDGNRYGLDFTFKGPPYVIAEMGYSRNQENTAAGLTTNFKIGAYFNGGSVSEYGSDGRSSGRYGFYVVADQELVRWGSRAENRHLGVFASLVCAPDESVNVMPYFFDAGVVAYGPMSSRPKDFLALGVAYGSFSSNLQNSEIAQQNSGSPVTVQDYEMTTELSYGCEIRPGLIIQPALQYIVHPGGSSSIPNALAIGANIVVNF